LINKATSYNDVLYFRIFPSGVFQDHEAIKKDCHDLVIMQ